MLLLLSIAFILIKNIKTEIPEKKEGTFIESFYTEFNPIEARYLRVVAKNKALCPMWHPGAGNPAWIFCDEITIN